MLSFQLISLYLYLYTVKRNPLALAIFLLKISLGKFNLFTADNVLFPSSLEAMESDLPTLQKRSPFLESPVAVSSLFLKLFSIVS